MAGRILSGAVVSLAAALAVAGCAGASTGGGGTDASGYPVTVENCGVQVRIEKPPERVLIANSAPVQYLAELDVLDRVTARAGRFPPEYYGARTRAALDQVPSLTDELKPDGHLTLSRETIIGEEPDLVLGLPEGVTRESLQEVGIPVLVEPSFCPDGLDEVGYEVVYDQMRLYGEVFDRAPAAETAIEDFRERLNRVQERLAGDGAPRTAALLWPYRGQGAVGAYGAQSMATPQLEALGFENVYGDADERVFETSMESLLARDPDVIVLLHTTGSKAEIRQALLDMPGADELSAVQNDRVMVQLFNYTEPPTPLVLEGAERIAERFGGGRP